MVRLVGSLVGLDPRCVRFYRLLVDHGADLARIRSAAERGRLRTDAHLVDALARRRRPRLARRPGRSKAPFDDLDSRLFAVQFRSRIFADPAVFVDLSRAARDLYGSRMASRGGLGDGELADPLPRFYERYSTGIVGYRLRVVE